MAASDSDGPQQFLSHSHRPHQPTHAAHSGRGAADVRAPRRGAFKAAEMNYQRIACLSTEAVETLYLLGAEEQIAGIPGFATRPARARKEKPKASGFSSATTERILAVEPDLV